MGLPFEGLFLANYAVRRTRVPTKLGMHSAVQVTSEDPQVVEDPQFFGN
eukprot:SAG11_NODE_26903_length_339_cov_1.033333_1_plen_48_part_01